MQCLWADSSRNVVITSSESYYHVTVVLYVAAISEKMYDSLLNEKKSVIHTSA